MTIELMSATEDDLTRAVALLKDAGLPTDDLSAEHLDRFLVARSDNKKTLAGLIGLEQYAGIGLLRSLVVAPAGRGAGLGRRLVAALENHARSAGVRELWLLTIDADRFFATIGYIPVSRDAAPESIRATREFSELCPGDAVLMRKSLADSVEQGNASDD